MRIPLLEFPSFKDIIILSLWGKIVAHRFVKLRHLKVFVVWPGRPVRAFLLNLERYIEALRVCALGLERHLESMEWF